MGRSKKRKMRKAQLRRESENYRVAKAWRNIFVKAGII
ncbi:DUF3983 domain-containing protein [Bacillus manliponensis]|nr:DUF3983 domain-containing protein [Bacillus manliponensis]